MTSGLSPNSALSLVRQRTHALRQSTELFEEAHTVAVLSRVVDVPVGSSCRFFVIVC